METLSFRLKFFVSVLAIVTVAGTFGFMIAEDLSIIDALYLSVITISTVGYGDIVPSTPAGKTTALLLVMIGVGTFLGVVANVTEVFLSKRDKTVRKEKLHIIVGVFFSESGTQLLRMFASYDPDTSSIQDRLHIKDSWTAKDYESAKKTLRNYKYSIDASLVNFPELRDFLESKAGLFMRLLENPYILEHETFTNLLRAVLHLKEELRHRENFDNLPKTDIAHLGGDIRRVYTLIVIEWLDYIAYLQRHYPYLFSLARRTNPLDPQASVVVS